MQDWSVPEVIGSSQKEGATIFKCPVPTCKDKAGVQRKCRRHPAYRLVPKAKADLTNPG